MLHLHKIPALGACGLLRQNIALFAVKTTAGSAIVQCFHWLFYDQPNCAAAQFQAVPDRAAKSYLLCKSLKSATQPMGDVFDMASVNAESVGAIGATDQGDAEPYPGSPCDNDP